MRTRASSNFAPIIWANVRSGRCAGRQCILPSRIRHARFQQLTSAGIQTLLDNLDRLTSYPPLSSALAYSEAATPEQKELLAEFETNAVLKDSEIEEAAAEAEPDVKKRRTLLQRLSQMNIVQRIQLAVKGGREERMLLIRDTNKIVQRGVLQSPRLTDTEIENFAAMANLSQEILRSIAMTASS